MIGYVSALLSEYIYFLSSYPAILCGTVELVAAISVHGPESVLLLSSVGQTMKLHLE